MDRATTGTIQALTILFAFVCIQSCDGGSSSSGSSILTPTKGTASDRALLNGAINYISLNNRDLHKDMRSEVRQIIMFESVNPNNSEAIMTGDSGVIAIYLPAARKFPDPVFWAAALIHEYLHIIGFFHGQVMSEKQEQLYAETNIPGRFEFALICGSG